jgi:long-chain fatty acid transport protein
MSIKSLIFLCTIIFCYTIAYSQDGTRAIDYNTRSTGRGGVSIGFFDNPSVMLTNPAGMSFLKNDMLDINAIFMVPPPKFTNYKKDALGNTSQELLNNAVDGSKTLYVLPSLAYNRKISNKFTLGAGVFTTGGMGADFTLNHELYKDALGNYIPQTYHSRFSTVQGGLSGAYKITDNFSVGITAQLLWASLEFKNPFSMSPLSMKGQMAPSVTFGQHFAAPRDTALPLMGLGYTEVTSSADMKELNAYSFAGKIGLAYKFSDKFTIGASYSTPVPLKFKNGISNLDMSAQFNDAFTKEVQNAIIKYHITDPEVAKAMVTAQFTSMGIDVTKGFTAQYDIENEFEIPQSVGFGINYNPSERIRLGFDFEWINWKKSFDKMKLTLKNGTNSNINILLGQGGKGQPDFLVDFLLNWKDAVILKFGGEFDLSKKSTIRLGYAYGTNPVTSETAIPIIPAVLEHHIMAGFSYLLTNKLMTNIGIEYGLNNKVTDSNPQLNASEYNSSIVELRNLLGHLSLTYNF